MMEEAAEKSEYEGRVHLTRGAVVQLLQRYNKMDEALRDIWSEGGVVSSPAFEIIQELYGEEWV